MTTIERTIESGQNSIADKYPVVTITGPRGRPQLAFGVAFSSILAP